MRPATDRPSLACDSEDATTDRFIVEQALAFEYIAGMEERSIGSYKILENIGVGGMAKVYLAVHQDVPNLKVILKVLSDPRLGARFRQEADKLALLDGHQNVCRIKHFFNHGEDTVIAMEYIDGVTLDEKIRSKGRLPLDQSLQIIGEVLDTLEFAHQKGIFHRDIKPSNIMIDASGGVKIIDFGIAKGKTDPNLTLAGTACGTPAYMAPEQFDPSEDANYALTDIYAVGITLYYMLCGELPFKGDNEFAIRDSKLFSDPVNPRSLCKNLPRNIEQAILKSISRNPGDRYSSALATKEALLGSAAAELASARTEVMPTRQTVGKPRRTGAAFVFTAVVAVLAVAAYFFWPSTGPPRAPQLISPWDETMIDNTSRPTFTWHKTAGSDGIYDLQYAADSLFVDAQSGSGLPETTYTAVEELTNGDYYWRVRAIGADQTPSPWSPIYSFTIQLPTLAPAVGRLQIAVNSPSDIFVNGSLERRNASNWEAETDTGTYFLRIANSRSTEKAISDTVYVAADQTVSRNYSFTFPEVKPATTPNRGKLAVLSIPTGAMIFVDGFVQEEIHTPHTLTLETGERVIKVILPEDGEQTLQTTFTVERGGEGQVMFDFERDTVLFEF